MISVISDSCSCSSPVHGHREIKCCLFFSCPSLHCLSMPVKGVLHRKHRVLGRSGETTTTWEYKKTWRSQMARAVQESSMLSSEAEDRSSWHEVPASPEEDVGKSDPNLLHLTPAASRPSTVPACKGTALKQSCLNRWFMILAAVKHFALFFPLHS